MNAIVLVVDQLQAGYLGCYGNSWIATPAMDRLASQSFLFDQAMLESPRLDDFHRACWGAASAIGPHVASLSSSSLPAMLHQQQVQTGLVSDDAEIFAHSLSRDWGQTVRVPRAEPSRRAESYQDCQFARVFAAATQWLAAAREPFVLWTHFRGMGGAWDAPLEFRHRYFEEDELEVPEFIDPPRMRLGSDEFDPDELLKIRWSYAAQVSLFDACLAEFLRLVDTPELLASTAMVSMSPRGYPLGEHRCVGLDENAQPALHTELVHLPCLLRMPGQEAAAMRSQALVQPADLHATLLELFELHHDAEPTHGRSLLPLVRGEMESLRDHVLLVSGQQERAIRTPAWYLRHGSLADGSVARQLFVKPDDRWEVNEVADRCPDIADKLLRTLAEEAAQSPLAARSPLDETLVHGLA